MTPQLQEIKDRLSKIESDIAEARKMLEKVETEAKNAEPWRPIHNEPYYFVYHDGIRWRTLGSHYETSYHPDIERTKAGNSFRAEANAKPPTLVEDVKAFVRAWMKAAYDTWFEYGKYDVIEDHQNYDKFSELSEPSK